MAEDKSIYTRVVEKKVEEINQLEERLSKKPALPFMEQKVTARQFRSQWEKMGEQERRQLVQEHGLQKVMENLGIREE